MLQVDSTRCPSHLKRMYYSTYLSLLFILIRTNDGRRSDDDEGAFRPLTVPKPKELNFDKNSLGDLLGTDRNGCFCRSKTDEFILCYGRDGCTAMPEYILTNVTTLKIANTYIEAFKPGDFKNFVFIVDLQVEGNFVLTKIVNATFQELNNLVSLSLSFNDKLKYLEPGAFSGLINLKELFLRKNGFTNLPDINYSLRPPILPSLETLVLDENRFGAIGENDFQALTDSKLQILSLTLCTIYHINPKGLDPLKKLEQLHIGENNIELNDLTNMLSSMIDSGINLKALNLFDMGFIKAPPQELMRVIAKTNVSRLNLSKNQFETIDLESFPHPMPNLLSLELKEVLALEVVDGAFSSLSNLQALFLSGNKLTQIPKAVLNLGNLRFLDLQNNSPPGESHHIHFSLRKVDFSNMTSLEYLNLGFNSLAHLFNDSFLDLPNLKVLKLNNCSIYHIKEATFNMVTKLRVLDLQNNLMVHDSIPDVFSELINLETLLLGGCNLPYVVSKNGTNPFRTLINLRYLSLERNMLKMLSPGDFAPLKSLQFLDLSYNVISSWEERMFSENVNLTRLLMTKNKLGDITFSMFEDLAQIGSVNFDQNVINCKCGTTLSYFQKWQKFSTSSNQIRSVFDPQIGCGYPETFHNVTVKDFLTDEAYEAEACRYRRTRLLLLVPFTCTTIFFTVFCLLAFWYRWHIKYWIFLAKLYLSRKGRIRSDNRHKKCYDNYEYDAFVSYSNEDRDFVLKLITMLETYQPFYKLCVYERDFQIGTIISESVLESVAKSRKTLLVISNNYAKSQWCRWESQICEHHRLFFEDEHGEYVDDSLVLVKISQVSETYLTPTLKYLLKTRIYLDWMSDGNKEEAFWTKLRDTLGSPICSIQV